MNSNIGGQHRSDGRPIVPQQQFIPQVNEQDPLMGITAPVAKEETEISANTLDMMDKSIKNLSEGVVGEPVSIPDIPSMDETPLDAPIDSGELAIDVPEIDTGVESEKVYIKDETPVAINMAFIGTGQAGGNLVAILHKELGYRRTMIFNTTMQDITGLNVPNEMVFDIPQTDTRGAGKDPKKGKKAIDNAKEDFLRFLKKRTGDVVDHIIICFGAGGGTGSGTVYSLIDIAKSYLMDLGMKDVNKRVGVIMSLPTRAEGTLVNQNAYEVAQNLCNDAKKGNLSPLLIIDNEKIRKLYKHVPVGQFWTVTNRTITQLFNIFAYMASRSSSISTFDVEDYKSILASGMITCGMSKLDAYKPGIDLPKMFRDNLQKNLFATDINFETVTHAAAILAADAKSLQQIPSDDIESTFEGLNVLFGRRKGLMLHRGVYESRQPGVKLFTIVGGFDTPQTRLEEIYRLGGTN